MCARLAVGDRSHAGAVTAIIDHVRRLAVMAIAASLLGGCGSSRPGPAVTSTSASPFAYARTPLGFIDRGPLEKKSPLALHDVSFAGPGGQIPGYLVLPPKRGHRVPAVLILHGAGGDRGEFLTLAGWIAARGAVALTITAPSSSAPPAPAGARPRAVLRRERGLAVADVVAARRAVDVLRSLPQVDPNRIGVLGWSAGARTGAVLAGAEPRIRALVLMSGGAVPVSEYAAAAPASLRTAVQRTLAPIDPLRWIARGRPGTIFLQNGRLDTEVPRRALVTFARAAPPRTLVRWYPAGHALNVRAEHDQLAWLAQKLGIRGPAVRGARTGP
jgi:dienelactone hydrolase